MIHQTFIDFILLLYVLQIFYSRHIKVFDQYELFCISWLYAPILIHRSLTILLYKLNTKHCLRLKSLTMGDTNYFTVRVKYCLRLKSLTMGDTNYFTVWVKYCQRPKSLTMGDSNYFTVWVKYCLRPKSLTIGDTNYNILLYELNTAYDVNNGQH
jgi:hypothetical protein